MELKFEYTQNNHFKWGWGDEWYNKPNPSKQFKIQLGYVTRPVERFRNECINAAKLIASKATKPIIVGLSGGSDSQMVCLSFREAGIPFKVVIVRMNDKQGRLRNGHDIKTAYEFCKKYDIEYINFNLNIDEFYETKGAEYAKKYGFLGVHTILQCATMDFVCNDYCYIMAGGDIMMVPIRARVIPAAKHRLLPISGENITDLVWWQKPQPVMQHMIEMGYEGTSKFFLYTPELISAYLMDPAVQDFIRSRDIIYEVFINWFPNYPMWWRCFHFLFKPLMTTREWPEMIPVRKFTGFEQLQGKDFASGEELEYSKILTAAAAGKTEGQVVATPIVDLVQYVNNPHTHSLTSTKVAVKKKKS